VGGLDNAIAALSSGVGALGTAISSWTTRLGADVSAISAGFAANVQGLSPFETRKVGIIINNMKDAGYSEEKAQAICRALFGEQSDGEMQAAFHFFDVDASGHIDAKEFRRALPLMGEDVPAEKVDALFKLVDKNGSGTIDFPEFCVLVRGMNPKEREEPQKEEPQEPSEEPNLGDNLRNAWESVTKGWWPDEQQSQQEPQPQDGPRASVRKP